jgi:hypothetical protein
VGHEEIVPVDGETRDRPLEARRHDLRRASVATRSTRGGVLTLPYEKPASATYTSPLAATSTTEAKFRRLATISTR